METQATNDSSFQQQNTMEVIAEETTTLAEGPTISIQRCRVTTKDRVSIGTYMFAAHNRSMMRMRVDDIPPSSMRQYLELMVRQINLYRAEIQEAPDIPRRAPDTVKDFVHNMAQAGMFIFGLKESNDVEQPTDKGIPQTGSKTPKQRKRKNH